MNVTPLVLMTLLSACAVSATSPVTKIETLTIGDLASATALATAAGDENGAQCWQYLSGLVPAIQAPATIGAATAAEVTRLAQLPAFAKACAAVGQFSGLPPALTGIAF